MKDNADGSLLASDFPEIVSRIRARTPARLLMGRVGAGYRTATQLELRRAHAAARDAVRVELDLEKHLGSDFTRDWNLFEVSTQATSKDEYLLRPDLGRRFAESSQAELMNRCKRECDLQIVIGDGLSVTAIAAQVPKLLPALFQGAKDRDWTIGDVFSIRYCRVGILNEIGMLLRPRVAILLIGERPGLATAESLSAYMAYRPQSTHTDAERNLISNIHSRGVTPKDAADLILRVAAQMTSSRLSGIKLQIQSTVLMR